MSVNPAKIDKYLYISRTPTWKVRLLYLYGVLTWLLVVYGYFPIVGLDPVFNFFIIPTIVLLTIYHLASFGLNLFYKQFDVTRHIAYITQFWKHKVYPEVDIFLPICGEDTETLKNTWTHVANIDYPNIKVYVIDDSRNEITEHAQLAKSFGFFYLERTNKGHMKKAGNLKHAYERSKGNYIAIFDADFAPHPDFIKETLPYMQNPHIGIVQTPQYFDTSTESYHSSHLAYNAAYAEEPFYRFIQVTRNRFKASICCGSNALYRRAALDSIGGPYQIEYSEDAHTGFEMTKNGYGVFYMPVILAIGLCPDNHYAFFHQQHRWSMGSMRLMTSRHFWFAPVSWKIKLCYITGFMFYLHHPLVIVFSFHLFWVLFLYNEYIPSGGDYSYYPHLIFAIIYVWLFPIARLKVGYFGLLLARTYAYSHAVLSTIFRQQVGWVSTNAKHKSVSKAFLQTITLLSVYVLLYGVLVLIGMRTGDIHLFDIRYWSIQFWLFYNLLLAVYLLIKLNRTAVQIR